MPSGKDSVLQPTQDLIEIPRTEIFALSNLKRRPVAQFWLSCRQPSIGDKVVPKHIDCARDEMTVSLIDLVAGNRALQDGFGLDGL